MPGTAGEPSAVSPPHRVAVRILDDDFVFRGTAPPAHLHRLAAEVDTRMRQLQAEHPNLSRHRLALLVALHLADEAVRLREENERLRRLLEDMR